MLLLLLLLLLLLQDLALDAVQTVARDVGGGSQECDIKNYAKVEKIPGGTIEDCKVGGGGGGACGRGGDVPCMGVGGGSQECDIKNYCMA
jgi:hypothetical protein